MDVRPAISVAMTFSQSRSSQLNRMSFRLSSRAKSLERSGTSVSLVFGFDFVEVDLEPVLFEEVEREPPEARVVVAFGAFSSTS